MFKKLISKLKETRHTQKTTNVNDFNFNDYSIKEEIEFKTVSFIDQDKHGTNKYDINQNKGIILNSKQNLLCNTDNNNYNHYICININIYYI